MVVIRCYVILIRHVHGVSDGEICPVLIAADSWCTLTLFIPEPKNPQVQGTTNSFFKLLRVRSSFDHSLQ